MNEAKTDFHVAAAGLKGLNFLRGLEAAGYRPSRVYSYPQRDDFSGSFARIETFCRNNAIQLEEERRPAIAPRTRTFLVGWQYLFDGPSDSIVVFHDSLLPEYRGFAPTVTALITGARQIGVTAFRPDEGVDTGPVYLQEGFAVEHPMRIADALERQAQLMAGLALSILRADAQGRPLTPTPQDETCASYSIWRDRLDFDLDPRRDASEIVRRVYALGHPYQGALIAADGETLTVRDAVEVEDLNFALRDPGKVWRIDADGPVMICGRGLVKFTDLQDAKGRPWMPTRLRTRFAPTWNGEHNPLA